MTIPSSVQAAIARLSAYNGNNYDPVANPYGFDSYGNRINFPQCLHDVSAASTWINEVANDIALGQGAALPDEVTIASASTVDLGAVASLSALITGTAPITSFGTTPNLIRFIKFGGALTLAHNDTWLYIPGGANITTASGDTAIVTSNSSGQWIVRHYQRLNGWSGTVPTTLTAYTPILTVSSGTITTLGGSGGAYIKLAPKTAWVTVTTDIVSNGSGSGTPFITLPFAAGSYKAYLSGREDLSTGKSLKGLIAPGDNRVEVHNYDNTYPGGSGTSLNLSGVYQVA